jgi:hypothetical protein
MKELTVGRIEFSDPRFPEPERTLGVTLGLLVGIQVEQEDLIDELCLFAGYLITLILELSNDNCDRF